MTASKDKREALAEADSRPDRRGGRGTASSKGSFWKELLLLVGIALVLTFLVQTFVARVYVIPSGSMERTLHGCPGCTGDRILVDKVTYDFTQPKPGDVIVFKGPPGWEQSEFDVRDSNNIVVRWLREFGSSIGIGAPPEYDLVKRVIAVGGQTVSCCDSRNRVVVDGKPLDEPYVYWQPDIGGPNDEWRFAPVTVPPGYLWVMGDNRLNSDDSRIQNGGGIKGVVPVANVIGIARTIIWPPGRWGGIGEINAQAMALHAPAWQEGLPAGIGVAATGPTWWVGRRLRTGLRRRAGVASAQRFRRKRE